MTNDDHNGEQARNPDRRPEGHLDEGDLILYLDRELATEDAARVRSHLEACDACRNVQTELAQASAVLSSLQREIDDALPAPPRNWAGFDERLAGELAEQPAIRTSWLGSIKDAWRKLRPATSVLPWGLASAAAGLLLAYLWFHANSHPVQSMAEIVNHAQQSADGRPMADRVVYRKLRISASAGQGLPTTVELWKRRTDGRVAEFEASPMSGAEKHPVARTTNRAASGGHQNSIPVSEPHLLSQVHQLYADNHLDWSEPISAGEFKGWIDSGGPKDEQVIHETLPDGSAGYRLTARSRSPVITPSHDVLSELQLLVRATDWHAIAEQFTVQSSSGVRTYEVAELEYRELPLSDVPGFVFEAKSAAMALAGDLLLPTLGSQTLSGTALSIEVLRRLDAQDALIKDQVQIARVGQEGLKVEGTLASDQRKSQILAALGPLASNPALKIDLLSPSEARERAFALHSASRPTQIQAVQVQQDGHASNLYLRNWLAEHRGLAGSQLNSEAENYQMRALILSSDAQLQAQVLSRILAVAPAAPADVADSETWRSLVNRHAAAAREQIQSLEQYLTPVFKTGSSPLDPDKARLDSVQNLKGQADGLVDLITASDHLLWQAFSEKAADSPQNQLTDPKFWLMLEEEDALAAHMMQKGRP
jgi:anti-sigma factor RsiW